MRTLRAQTPSLERGSGETRTMTIEEHRMNEPEFKTKTVTLIQGEKNLPTKEILKRHTR